MNSIQHNKNKGAISIVILFMKEKRNMAVIESKEDSEHVPDDGFLTHEIGKILTVVKHTRE
jgi:hypothetical protein